MRSHVPLCVRAQGLGTDEETLIEILSTRSRKKLDDISAAYTFCESRLFVVAPAAQKCERSFVVFPVLQCIRRT